MTSASSQTRKQRATVPIWVKMTAALIVPLAAVAAMSLVQINQAKDKVARVDRETDLARVALAPGGVVDGLIVERGDATVSVLGLRETTTLPTKSLAESIAMTDKGVKDLRAAVAAGGPEAAAAFGDTLDGVERDLEFVRKDVIAASKNAGLDNWDLSNTAYFAYKGIIDDLMRANDALAARITDPDLRAAAVTLNEVNRAHDAISNLSRAVGTAIAPSEGNAARDAVVAYLAAFRDSRVSLSNRTDGPWKPQVDAYAKNPPYDQLTKKAQEFLDTGNINLDEFIGLNPKVDNRRTAPMGTTQAIAQKVDSSLTARIEELRSNARSEQTRYTILSLAVLLAATVIASVIARSVTRPMLSLARQAEEMATTRLPAAVSQVLNTAPGSDVTVPEIPPVKVRSRDEVQAVAAALNNVQTSALDLAVEQATLRRNIADSYVSMGRRTQNLIGLQLEQISELERDEADPTALEALYRLDHLATRARRNAESLVVLAGTESQRHGAPPAPMTDVIRATLSEVEAYQRVDVAHLDDAWVLGAVAGDLVHLLAELVENGLAFSPPSSRVEIEGRGSAAGYTLRVVDHGVGMTAQKVEESNRRLAGRENFTVAPSRYLGHYVTGRLAERVGAQVSLHPGQSDGIVAEIVLAPSALLGEAPGTAEPAPELTHDAPTSTPEPPTQGADGVDAAANGSSASGPMRAEGLGENIRVDGRPPAVEDLPELEELPTGLRKRVPGRSSQVVRDRSPLLRSGASEAAPVASEALADGDQAQNLASLLTSYTAGLERGREDAAEDTGER